MDIILSTACASPPAAAREGHAMRAGLIGDDYTDAYAVELARLDANGRIRPRVSAHNQAFYVMEGEGIAVLAGESVALSEGALVKVPRGVRHAVRNTGTSALRLLVIQDPPKTSGAAPDASGNTARPANVVDVAAIPWNAFAAPGVQGYELKPMLVGEEHTDAYSVDLMRVAAGGFSEAHTDRGRHAFVILTGQGRLTVDGEPFDFRQGDVVKVPAGSLHALYNVADAPLEFLAIYDPPRRRKAG